MGHGKNLFIKHSDLIKPGGANSVYQSSNKKCN